MKISAKILAIALALVMVFTFAGCGAKSPEELIIGDWAGEISLVKIMEAAGGTNLDAFEDVDDVPMTLEFNDKGVVVMEVDATDIIKSSAFKDAITDFILSQSGITEEDLEAQGVDVDSIIEESIDQMKDQLSQKKTVKYEFDGEKLYIDEEKQDYEFEDDDTLVLDMSDFGEVEFERD